MPSVSWDAIFCLFNIPIERFIGPFGSLVLGQDAMMLHSNHFLDNKSRASIIG